MCVWGEGGGEMRLKTNKQTVKAKMRLARQWELVTARLKDKSCVEKQKETKEEK